MLKPSQRYAGMIHVCVCVGRGRGGGGGEGGAGACLWVYLASVSGPMCTNVFVIRVTARRFSLPLRIKIKY